MSLRKVDVASSLKPVLFLLVYKATLDLSYWLIVPEAGYYALHWNFSAIKLVESYILALIVPVLIPKSSEKLSHLLVWLLVLLSYIPMLTVFASTDGSRVFMYAVSAFWLGVFFMLSYMPMPHLRPIRQSQARVVYLSLYIGMSIVSLLVIYQYFGFRVGFDLSKVYDVRSQFVEAELPLKGYYLHWMASVLNPIFLAISITNKRWFFAILTILFQLLIASHVGIRSYYFILPFALCLMWVGTRKDPLTAMGTTASAAVIFDLLLFSLAYVDMGFLVPVHARALFVPAQLSLWYYDFFSSRGFIPFVYTFKYYFKILDFRDYPYDLSPDNLIGSEYFNNPELAAVTGVVGDAYMNLGFLGLALWAMVLVVILRLLDGCSKGVDSRVGIAAIAMPALSISSTYLIRALLTGGLVCSLVTLFLLRGQRRQ